MGYIDNDGEINEDRYQAALEKQWDEEYEELNPQEQSMDELVSRSSIYKKRLDQIGKDLADGRISVDDFDSMRRDASYHYSRKAKDLGTGMYVYLMFSDHELVEGDTFWDCDYGSLTWNGDKWINSKRIDITKIKR
jgi:hypothetical protein